MDRYKVWPAISDLKAFISLEKFPFLAFISNIIFFIMIPTFWRVWSKSTSKFSKNSWFSFLNTKFNLVLDYVFEIIIFYAFSW